MWRVRIVTVERRLDMESLNVGDHVEKTSGYLYPGIIVAKFETTAGEIRYVVECDVAVCRGMLHIYNGNQLKRRAKRNEAILH